MFYTDKPIDNSRSDKLNRHGFAKRLADAIYSMINVDTFTIGLYGKWGSGKTSVIKMMLEELENLQSTNGEGTKVIVVNFEPWNFTDSNQLIEQFFLRLSNELRSTKDKTLSSIGDALQSYSDAFELAQAIPVMGGLLAILGKKSALAIGKRLKRGAIEDDIQSQKNAVIELLKGQPYKILIVIDDIDRLSDEKIRQVFQLIASVANFPNTIYLVAFDKDIVSKALEEVQHGSGESYLEKIIQMPIQIPDIIGDRLISLLFERLGDILEGHENYILVAEHWQKISEHCILPFIKDIRCVNRLCNSLEFKMSAIASEVNFADMVAITTFEISIPAVYTWIKEHKALLTGSLDLSDIGDVKTSKEYKQIYMMEFKEILSNSERGKVAFNADSILTALSFLFPSFGGKIGKTYTYVGENSLRLNCNIGIADKFDRYFDLDIDNVGIRKAEAINAALSLSADELKSYILKCDNDKTSYELLKEINAMASSLPSERLAVILEALLGVIPMLDTYISDAFLPFRIGEYAELLAFDTIKAVPESERCELISSFISKADSITIQSLAGIVRKIEMGYGRFVANSEEDNDKKLITLDELKIVECAFTERVKELIASQNLLDFSDWRTVCYLMSCLDSEYMDKYFKRAFIDDTNVVKYLEDTVTMWTGSGVGFEVQDVYKKYLSEERILEAIGHLVDNGGLFCLPPRVQDKAVAFYLNNQGKQNYAGHIDKRDVDAQLKLWRETDA